MTARMIPVVAALCLLGCKKPAGYGSYDDDPPVPGGPGEAQAEDGGEGAGVGGGGEGFAEGGGESPGEAGEGDPDEEGHACPEDGCGEPTRLAGGINGPVALALDADHIWWLEHGTYDDLGNYQVDGRLRRLARGDDAGDPEVVKEGLNEPRALAIGEGHACWTEAGDPGRRNGRVVCRDVAEGVDVVLFDELRAPPASPQPGALAIHDGRVFYAAESTAEEGGHGIWHQSLAAPEEEAEALISFAVDPPVLGVADSGLLWFFGDELRRAADPQAEIETVLRETTPPRTFVVRDETLFLLNEYDMQSVGLDSGRPINLVQGGEDFGGQGLAVTEVHVWWFGRRNGDLFRTDRTPGQTFRMVPRDFRVVAALATGDDGVYWLSGYRTSRTPGVTGALHHLPYE